MTIGQNGRANGALIRAGVRTTRLGLLLGGVAAVGCATSDVTTGTGTNDRILMTPRSVSIQVGESVQMVVTITDSQGRVLTGQPVTFTARDAGIATVTIDQKVIGLARGQTIVSAVTAQGSVASSEITVTAKP